MNQVVALRPFIPARDFERSRRFYQAIGFTIGHSDTTIAMLELGDVGFILQNFYVEEFAENTMLQLVVRDVDAWWRGIDPARLVAEFGIKPPTAPVMQNWGLKVGFLADPSNVLWHMTEAPEQR